MRFGLELQTFSLFRGKYNLNIHIPFVKIGYFSDHFADGDKWTGIKIDLVNEISYEIYDYGKVFKFIILGMGIEFTITDI